MTTQRGARTHILSMTYQPKIAGVMDGTIRQTTRIYNKNNLFKVDDCVLIHGWAGKPYRTPWNWRLPKMPVTQAIDMYAFDKYAGFWQHPLYGTPFSLESGNIICYPWHDVHMNSLSELDGIVPATGIEYQNVLEKFHGKFTDEPVRFQVIRW